MGLMDQGWAAVVAGVVGLVGAIGGAAVGGIAAIWGARQQVRDQADRDHRRWIREERQKAYAQVLEAFTAYGSYAELVTVKLWKASGDAADPLPESDWDQLVQVSLGVQMACSKLGLFGPDVILQAGNTLRHTCGNLTGILHTWREALQSGEPPEQLLAINHERRERGETMRASYRTFMATGQEVLMSGAEPE